MTYINLTPHTITLNDGTSFLPHDPDNPARVSSTLTPVEHAPYPTFSIEYGEVTNLPPFSRYDTDSCYIVSAMVKAALPERPDLVSPATGHPDTKHDEQGRIVSVPGFIH